VRTQIDRDLTTVSWVDRLLGLIKNLGRHTRSRGYKLLEWWLGQRGRDWAPKWAGPAGLGPPRPSPRPPSLVLLPEPSIVFSLLHVDP
jgi:hypothetical protein